MRYHINQIVYKSRLVIRKLTATFSIPINFEVSIEALIQGIDVARAKLLLSYQSLLVM